LNKLDKTVKTSLIFNPNLTTIELLQAINEDFGIEGKSISKKELVDALNTFLLKALKDGGNAVLIIDEAQNLTPECLEEIRMLSNLETDKEKLLQIILVGQPELRKKLDLERLKQLNQRIALRYHLEPFDENETREYIYHRLKIAGGADKVFFTTQAVEKIYEFSKGTPRLINLLCDKVLLAGFVADTKTISHHLVKTAIKELRGDSQIQEKRPVIFNDDRLPERNIITKPLSIAGISLGVLLIFSIIFWQKTALIGAISGDKPDYRQQATDSRPQTTTASQVNEALSYDEDGILRVKDQKDSLPASIMTLLKTWKVEFLKNDISLLKNRGEGEQREFIRNLGFEIYKLDKFEQIEILDYPTLVSITKDNEPYYVVLRQIDNGKAVILDPLKGRMAYNMKEFMALWKGEGVILWKKIEGVNLPISGDNPNSEVMALQGIFKNKGVYAGRIDGYYGPMTVKSVSDFQLKFGLNPTGNFDTETHMILSKNIRGKAVPGLKN
jgi:general secretion pathway protein A